MKRIIAVVLATVLALLALASCNNNTKKPDASTPSSTKQPSTPSGSSSSNGDLTPESTPDMTPENTTFDTRDEDVYVFNTDGGLKLRTSNNFIIDNVGKIVDNGTLLKRVGVGIEDPTVSKVVFEGKEYYCGSRYLTTEAPSASTGEADETVVFEDRNETVYVSTGHKDGEITVYSKAYKGWSSSNKKYVVNNLTLKEGTEVKRTGICFEDENDLEVGWSRIEYEGKTYYVRISVLSTKAPATDSTPAATTAATPAATTAA